MKHTEMRRSVNLTLAAVAVFLLLFAVEARAQNGGVGVAFSASRAAFQGDVPVIYNCNLANIGMTRFDQWGRPYIEWNPCFAQRVGQLVADFFYQHEMGHAHLRTASEDQADQYAVEALRFTNPDAIIAFIQFMESLGWGGGNLTHRYGIDRARFVARCFFGR
ncbi:MAG: hypothetical protein MOB07_04890 [Acidobacteria bacterium]|nr:hypothetical protein [Acidobacteriota bacterium]